MVDVRIASERNIALIRIALRGGKAWAHWNNGAFNRLDEQGLSETIKRGEVNNTHKLTQAGIEAVLALPDDLECDWFPLPQDIAEAKAIVRGLK